MIKKSFCEASHSHSHSPTPTHSHSHSHLILDPGSAYYDDAGGGFAPSSVNGVCRSRIQDQVAVAVAVAGLTKRFFNHIQKDFLINVWTVGGIITILGMQAEVAIQSRAATSGSIIISTHH